MQAKIAALLLFLVEQFVECAPFSKPSKFEHIGSSAWNKIVNCLISDHLVVIICWFFVSISLFTDCIFYNPKFVFFCFSFCALPFSFLTAAFELTVWIRISLALAYCIIFYTKYIGSWFVELCTVSQGTSIWVHPLPFGLETEIFELSVNLVEFPSLWER